MYDVGLPVPTFSKYQYGNYEETTKPPGKKGGFGNWFQFETSGSSTQPPGARRKSPESRVTAWTQSERSSCSHRRSCSWLLHRAEEAPSNNGLLRLRSRTLITSPGFRRILGMVAFLPFTRKWPCVTIWRAA